MSIKLKLTFAFGFLFSVIVLLGGMGGYYLRQLASDSKAIISENYESVEFAKNMMEALDNMQTVQTRYILNPVSPFDSLQYQSLISRFEKNMTAEENNITEIGEAGLAASLRDNYQSYLLAFKNVMANNTNLQLGYVSQVIPAYDLVKTQISKVAEINMQAILRKNQIAQQTADRVVAYMALIGTASIITALAFLIWFPSHIANPIKQLTLSIEEIANHNYGKRLDFDSNDEYGSLASAFNTMSLRLDEYEHSNVSKILFEKKRVETIINHMQDAIIGLDEHKNILFANPQALKIIGLEEADLVGKYAPDVALVNDLMRSLIGELMIGFQAWEKEEFKPLHIYANDKESFYSKEILDVRMSKTSTGKARLIGHVIILKNITRFKELDAAKTNFIATISHELKTPISSIKMSIKLLEDSRIGQMNEEQKKLVANIKDDSGRLLKITGELLDLAQVETGNIQLHIKETNPVEIIDYACQAVAFSAQQKHIQIEQQISEDLPAIQADMEKTVWVMVNLLSNAIRYAPENTKVIIQVVSRGQYIEFSVQDFGKGIDPVYQERIFEKFFQIPDTQESSSGTGLGLAISREFIQAQGGKIEVNSMPGQGSTFLFILPASKQGQTNA